MIADATLDLAELERGFAGLIAASRDLTPAMRAARRPLMDDQRDHAKRQAGPEGSWPARSSTARRGKARRRRRLLGRLPTAVILSNDRLSVRVTSRVKWSGSHKEGDRVGHGAKIPPRDFLWPSGRVLEIIAGIVANHFGRRWPR